MPQKDAAEQYKAQLWLINSQRARNSDEPPVFHYAYSAIRNCFWLKEKRYSVQVHWRCVAKAFTEFIKNAIRKLQLFFGSVTNLEISGFNEYSNYQADGILRLWCLRKILIEIFISILWESFGNNFEINLFVSVHIKGIIRVLSTFTLSGF